MKFVVPLAFKDLLNFSFDVSNYVYIRFFQANFKCGVGDQLIVDEHVLR